MSDVLVPYTEFNYRDLAVQLQIAVAGAKQLLVARNLKGPIARYGGVLDVAEGKVAKGQRETATGELSHVAVVASSGNVVGSASIDPNLKLKKQHVPLPPIVAVSFLTDEFVYAKPNISAWTIEGEEEVLVKAYSELAERTLEPVTARNEYAHNTPWTIEPTSSPRFIHVALEMAGLTKVATRRFDDQESQRRTPPRSVLYAKLSGSWDTAHGRQKELRKGLAKSWADELIDESNSRYAPWR